MRIARAVLGVAGVAFGLWGVWLMREFDLAQLQSLALWLAGGVVIHDFVLAPLTVAVGFVVSRRLPAYARTPAAVGLMLWGTVTVAAFNVLSGMGGRDDNMSLLNRPYVAWWVGLTALAVVAVTVVSLTRRRTT